MKVLVTGASGLVGRYIVQALIAAGHRPIAAGRRPPQEGDEGRFFSLDDPLSADLFAGMDALVHAAFDHLPGRYRGGEGDDPQGFRRRNLDGTLRLFEAAARAGLSHALFLSSRAVYGDGRPGERLAEDLAPRPTTLYGAVKLETEQALSRLNRPGFVTASLRATGVYGDLFPNKWEGLFADYLAGRPLASRAGSEVHGADVGAAICLLLESRHADIGGRVFNLSDIVVDTRDILLPLSARLAEAPALPEAADKSRVALMSCDALLSLGWRPGGRDLFEKTVKALADRFAPAAPFASPRASL